MFAAELPTFSLSIPERVTASLPTSAVTPGSIRAWRAFFSPRKFSITRVWPWSLSWIGKWEKTTFIRYSYPLLTPVVMFLMCEASVPTMATTRFLITSVETVTMSSPISIVIPGKRMSRVSVPFGPVTTTRVPSMETVTPAGISAVASNVICPTYQ